MRPESKAVLSAMVDAAEAVIPAANARIAELERQVENQQSKIDALTAAL